MAKRFDRGNGEGGAAATPVFDVDGNEVSHQEVYHQPPAWQRLPETQYFPFVYKLESAARYVPYRG